MLCRSQIISVSPNWDRNSQRIGMEIVIFIALLLTFTYDKMGSNKDMVMECTYLK